MRAIRYLFEYQLKIDTKTNSEKREFSIVANSEEEARAIAANRIADLEFVSESEIELGALIKSFAVQDNYFECEGCT